MVRPVLLRLGLGLLCALASTWPAAAAAAPATTAISAETPIEHVWLRADDLDLAALVAAVTARMPNKQVLVAGANPGPGRTVLCHVRSGAELSLDVIVDDGRVYSRSLANIGTDPERAAARLIATTLASIEDETTLPDRHDGDLSALVPAPTRTEPDTTEPKRSEPLVPTPTPAPVQPPEPASPPPNEPPSEPLNPPHAQPPPRTELAVALGGGPGLALGAPGRGLTSMFADLRVHARLRRAAVLGAAFRGGSHTRDDLRLARYRGAVGAGYDLRRGRFTLLSLAAVTLETWQVRTGKAPVVYGAAAPGTAMLVGAAVRVAPGLSWTLHGGHTRMQLRLVGELAASARTTGRAAQVGRSPGQPVFVLGGLESQVGLEFAVSTALRRR